MARTHSLTRTSPKGGRFIGRCFQCGTTDLPWEAVKWPCENVANLTKDEALLHAISGRSCDSDRSPKGEDGTASSSDESAGPEGIAHD